MYQIGPFKGCSGAIKINLWSVTEQFQLFYVSKVHNSDEMMKWWNHVKWNEIDIRSTFVGAYLDCLYSIRSVLISIYLCFCNNQRILSMLSFEILRLERNIWLGWKGIKTIDDYSDSSWFWRDDDVTQLVTWYLCDLRLSLEILGDIVFNDNDIGGNFTG